MAIASFKALLLPIRYLLIKTSLVPSADYGVSIRNKNCF